MQLQLEMIRIFSSAVEVRCMRTPHFTPAPLDVAVAFSGELSGIAYAQAAETVSMSGSTAVLAEGAALEGQGSPWLRRLQRLSFPGSFDWPRTCP